MARTPSPRRRELPPLADSRRDLEHVLRPLVDASHSPVWKDGLSILFISGPVLELTEELPLPVLIGRTGGEEGVEHFAELMKSRATSDVVRIVGSLTEKFIPQIMAVLREARDLKDPNEQAFVAGLVARFTGNPDSISNWIYGQLGAVVQGAVAVSDGLCVAVLDLLRDKRRGVLTNILDPSRHDTMLQCLQRLHLIEPRLQVSLCGRCGNNSMTISNSPHAPPHCPKCGFEWLIFTLFVFESGFAQVKPQNHDLPLFVSAYLRSKTLRELPVGEARIEPLVKVGPPENADTEIDVAVPELRLGIECKAFEDALAPMTRARVSRMTDDLAGQLARYVKAGFTRIGLVTNLSTGAAEKLKSAIAKRMPSLASRENGLRVIAGTPDALLSYLNGIAEELAKHAAGGLARRFEEKRTSPALPPAAIASRTGKPG